MGGTISLLYAGTFPKHVSKLALIEGIGPLGMSYADAPPRMEKWIARSARARPPPFSRVHERRGRRQPIAPNQSEIASRL